MLFPKPVYFKKKPNENQTQLEAYLLWEQAGKPEGKDKYFWDLAKSNKESRSKSDLFDNEIVHTTRSCVGCCHGCEYCCGPNSYYRR